MSKLNIQIVAIVALTALAGGLLALIGYTFHDGVAHMSPDGKVPLVDAGLFTTFLLSFQQTVTTMRSVWESQERVGMAEKLAVSTPGDPPAKDAAAGARQAADAADEKAATIETQAGVAS